jgi:hypothetical protein
MSSREDHTTNEREDWSIRRIKSRGTVTEIAIKLTNGVKYGAYLRDGGGDLGCNSSFVFPRRGIGPGLLPTIDASLNARDTIESGPDVKTEHGAAVRKRRSGVVVDDISNFFTRLWTVDDPIVSVEWWPGAV